jgi:hypothetical protein
MFARTRDEVIPRTSQKSAVKEWWWPFLAELGWCALIICLEVRNLTSRISRIWSCVKWTEGSIGEGGKAEPNQWGFTCIMPEFTQQEIVSRQFSAWRWHGSRSQPRVRTWVHATSESLGLQNRSSRMKFLTMPISSCNAHSQFSIRSLLKICCGSSEIG